MYILYNVFKLLKFNDINNFITDSNFLKTINIYLNCRCYI